MKRKENNRVIKEFSTANEDNLFTTQAKFNDCDIYIPPTNIISFGVISESKYEMSEA